MYDGGSTAAEYLKWIGRDQPEQGALAAMGEENLVMLLERIARDEILLADARSARGSRSPAERDS